MAGGLSLREQMLVRLRPNRPYTLNPVYIHLSAQGVCKWSALRLEPFMTTPLPFFSIHGGSCYLPFANRAKFVHQREELCGFFRAELGDGVAAELPGRLPHGQGLRSACFGEVHETFAFVGGAFAEGYPAFFFVVFADVEHGLFGYQPFVADVFLGAGLVFCVGGGEGVAHGVVIVGEAEFGNPRFYDGIHHADFFAECVEVVHGASSGKGLSGAIVGDFSRALQQGSPEFYLIRSLYLL